MNTIRAAAVQFEHSAGDKQANYSVLREFTQRAHGQGVDLLIFPEGCINGYWFLRRLNRAELCALAEPVPEGPSSQLLGALACETGMTIGAGLVEADGEAMYNTYVVAMPDGRFARHRKLHSFENEAISPGDEFTVFDDPHGVRLGVLICYDCNIGENVRLNALQGVEVLLAPHQTGGCKLKDPNIMGLVDREKWDNREADPEAIEAELRGEKGRGWLMRWLPSRAHDNGIFLMFSNGVGVDDDEIRTGNAMILDPYGRVLAETWKAGNDMVIADLDPALLQGNTGQRWIKSRRPELYGPLTIPTGSEESTRKLRMEESG